MMDCGECAGSGHCDACGGYGTTLESFPGAGDDIECEVCSGDGQCVECAGSGEVSDQVFETG